MMLFNFVSLVLCLLVAVGVAVPRPVSRRSQKSSLLLNVRDAGTDASDALGLPSSISDSLQTVTSVYSSSSFNHSLSLDISPSSQQGSPTVSSETSSRSLIPTSAPPVPSSSAHAVLSLPSVTSTPSSVTQPSSSAPVPSLSSPVSQSTASIPSAASSSPTTSETASSPPASSPLLPSLSSATKTSLPQTAPIETSALQSSSNLASSSSSSGSSVLSDASASFSAAQPSVPVSSSISVPVPSASSLSAPLTSVATSASSGLTTSISTTAPVSASTSVPSSASVSASSLTSASATASSGTPSSSRVPFPSPTTGPAEIAAYVDGHNKARFLAGSRPLSWDGALADLAKSYASQCRFQHSDGALGPFGENLVAGTGIFSAEAAVAQFISDGPSGKDEFTHWSQVVWKATTRLGCGVALCDHIFDQPATYHVCLYDPVGNVVGELQTNL